MAPPKRSGASQTPSFSSQASNYGDDDVRFVELLKPIKDLTANWAVPLAKYLEEYYEELTDLHISLDGRNTKVNFAEAALFLQGTASVYSKKVEFLWQNVLQMLDLLSSKKALEEASEDNDEPGDGSGKKRQKKAAFDGSQFELVSIEVARNTNLKSDSKDSSVHNRKMTLKFIFVTPRQLIEKEGKEQKMTKINMYVRTAGKYDLLGQKEEFRVNTQFALGTGMIGEELSAESELGKQSVSLCDDSDATLRNLSISAVLEEQVIESDDVHCQASGDLPPVFTDEIPEENMDDDIGLPDLPDHHESDEETGKNDDSLQKRRNVAEDLLNEPKAPLEDTWEPIEPHEVVTIPKPIREGRRKKTAAPAPNVAKVQKNSTRSRGGDTSKRSVYENSNNNGLTRVTVPIEEFLIHELQNGPSVTSIIEANLAPALRDDAVAEIKLRKSRQKDPEGENETESNNQEPEEKNVEEADKEANDDGWDDFLPDNDDFMPDIGDDDQPSTSDKEAQESGPKQESYEDLVMKQVASYVAQSQDYIQSTDLAKRVRAWHESLGPKLEAVEKRGDFDIHEYGSRILSRFPDDNRKTTVDFKDVASGSSHEEVARLFLSSLMLANAQNVEIACSASKSEYLPMDQVSMTLLSTQRHHEHMLDQIPDSQEDMNRAKVKRKKASKNKHLQAIPEESFNNHDAEYQEGLAAFDAVPVARKASNENINGGFVSPSRPIITSKPVGGRKKTYQ